MHLINSWDKQDIKRLNVAYLLTVDDQSLANCQFHLEFKRTAGSRVFLLPWSDHREQADRRGKSEVTDKGRTRHKLENQKLLQSGIRWMRYLTFDFESKSQKEWGL